jgi:hypothetical protein
LTLKAEAGEYPIMGMRRASGFTTGVSAVVLAGWLLPGCTLEQLQIGQWYTIYTPPTEACPGLAWRFVVDAGRSIGGFLSHDGRQPIATLTGLLNADDSFEIRLTDVAGNRTANVTGRFTSQVSTISIRGDAAGSECDGQTFEVRLGRYFSTPGGGGGGQN